MAEFPPQANVTGHFSVPANPRGEGFPQRKAQFPEPLLAREPSPVYVRAVVDLFQKRFIINTGKGGVGKSTLSAAMALAAIQKGKRVLVIELNTQERISKLLGAKAVGSAVSRLEENLWAVNITPQDAMREYVLMKFRLLGGKTYGRIFENRFVHQFLQVIPGLNDLVLIGKAWFHEQERTPSGAPKYDMIVVDAPATGHGRFFLGIPQVIVDAVPTGPMAAECRKILALLNDPERTILNLVTLTEEMPVNETIELHRDLHQTLNIPLGYVIANGIYPPLLSEPEATQLATLFDEHRAPDLLGRTLEAGVFRHQRCRLQAHYLRQIDHSIPMPCIEVPFYFEPLIDRPVIERIAAHIIACVERQAESG